MASHLVADAPAPWEYVELIMCRDVYHCTPPELKNVPLEKIFKHLACMQEEAKHRR